MRSCQRPKKATQILIYKSKSAGWYSVHDDVGTTLSWYMNTLERAQEEQKAWVVALDLPAEAAVPYTEVC